MGRFYREGEEIKNESFAGRPFPAGDYESCVFSCCDFSGSDLSHCNFIDCAFESSNLSLTKTGQASFRDVEFRNCKILGLRFDDCNSLTMSVKFSGCQISVASFAGLKLRKTLFSNSEIVETDFSGADLSGSVFDDCDLSRSEFRGCNLEGADFSKAHGFIIDPEANRIKNARFSLQGLPGLLARYDIVVE
ncbi:MAG: pentapeptide repeat-containing protein [Bacteroidales bacterium]